MKKSWMPKWHTHDYSPAFLGNGPPVVPFGTMEYVWGNTPALDILFLKGSEVISYDKDLHILLAGKICGQGCRESCSLTICSFRRLSPIAQFHVYPIEAVYRNWKLEHDNIS
jgi:hypothetical protein